MPARGGGAPDQEVEPMLQTGSKTSPLSKSVTRTVSSLDAQMVKLAKEKALNDAEDNEDQEKFNKQTEFSRAEQFGSRAVGGNRPDDEVLFGSIESSDYLVPDTKEEEAHQRTFTPAMRNRRRLFIWGLYAWLAVCVTASIVFILHSCETILKVRVKHTDKMLAKNDLLGAWLVWTGSGMVLVLVACVLVLWQPAAASSGIPGLIAFLNGVQPIGGESPLTLKKTGFLSEQTLLAKTVGMILSIPSGLCLGPEGPIIHIGALLAHHSTRFLQGLSHRVLPDRFQFTVKPGEARDFLATGAAVGICVAFRAPLAGCLFVVEEAASFFTVEHLEYTFFATVIAYLVAMYLAAPDDGFVKFKQATGYFCTLYDSFDILLFVVIAGLGGLLGAAFNAIVEHLNHLRAHHVNKYLWRRVLEVVVLTLVTGTVAIFLPNLYPCEHPTRSLLMQDSIGCLSEEDAYQISHGTVSHKVLKELLSNGNHSTQQQQKITELLGKYRVSEEFRVDSDDSYQQWKDTVMLDNADANQHIHLHYQHSYTCDSGDYNGMSMLWLNGGVKGVKVLMQRGFPHMLSLDVLLAYCAVYFLLAAYTSGVAVPAGLIVPHLLIGGSYGRAFGLLGIEEKRAACAALSDLEDAASYDTMHLSTLNFTDDDSMRRALAGESADPSAWMFDNTYYWSTIYRWIGRDCRLPDPGMYAVVGMSAFLSGSGRITMMLACVIVELTDDASLIAPVGVAAIVSMIVGNLFNHGLYHGLIPVMNLPFLNAEPADVMHLVGVADTMTRDVVSLSKSSSQRDIDAIIAQCDAGELTHNAFPVVDDHKTHKGKKLRGIISLDALKIAAQGGVGLGRRAVLMRRQRLGIKTTAAAEFEDRSMTEKEIHLAMEWLRDIQLLQDLSDELLNKLARHMQVGFVAPHKNIVTFGEPGDALYFVEEGGAEALVHGRVVMEYSRGGHFGELALITDEPRKATVRASNRGATLLRLERSEFEDTLDLKHRDINLLNFADRSPITASPHMKVARAFEMFRKLGMRHMCVVDSDAHLVGILTRKDLMTYRIAEHIMPHRVEVMIRDWLYRWRKKRQMATRSSGNPPQSPGRFGTSFEDVVADAMDDDSVGARVGVKMGKWREHAGTRVQGSDQDNDQPVAGGGGSARSEFLERENVALKRQLREMEKRQLQAIDLLQADASRTSTATVAVLRETGVVEGEPPSLESPSRP